MLSNSTLKRSKFLTQKDQPDHNGHGTIMKNEASLLILQFFQFLFKVRSTLQKKTMFSTIASQSQTIVYIYRNFVVPLFWNFLSKESVQKIKIGFLVDFLFLCQFFLDDVPDRIVIRILLNEVVLVFRFVRLNVVIQQIAYRLLFLRPLFGDKFGEDVRERCLHQQVQQIAGHADHDERRNALLQLVERGEADHVPSTAQIVENVDELTDHDR